MNKNLAINGGPKSIRFDFKARFSFGAEEKAAAMVLFDNAIANGNPFGYNGSEEDAYCKEFSQFLGGGFADGVNSGTNSVFVALKALDLKPFSEVIVGGMTDPGGIMPVVMVNCIPMIADAMPGSYNTGASQIEELITSRTSAIVIAHLGGEPCDIYNIMKVANRHNLPVIEDCSQSHGTKVNGQCVGTFGTIGAFSLMFGKLSCSGGQGGMVFTKDEKIYWQIRQAADRGKPFGLTGKTNVTASLNCNMDELGAAIGRVQLKKLSSVIKKRQDFAELLKGKGLDKLNAIRIPLLVDGGEHSYWWWRLGIDASVITCTKDEYCKALIAEGVLLAENYRSAMPYTFDWFRDRPSKHPWNNPLYAGDGGTREFTCPNIAESVDCFFNLGIRESWGEFEADAIMEAFNKVDKAYRK